MAETALEVDDGVFLGSTMAIMCVAVLLRLHRIIPSAQIVAQETTWPWYRAGQAMLRDSLRAMLTAAGLSLVATTDSVAHGQPHRLQVLVPAHLVPTLVHYALALEMFAINTFWMPFAAAAISRARTRVLRHGNHAFHSFHAPWLLRWLTLRPPQTWVRIHRMVVLGVCPIALALLWDVASRSTYAPWGTQATSPQTLRDALTVMYTLGLGMYMYCSLHAGFFRGIYGSLIAVVVASLPNKLHMWKPDWLPPMWIFLSRPIMIPLMALGMVMPMLKARPRARR